MQRYFREVEIKGSEEAPTDGNVQAVQESVNELRGLVDNLVEEYGDKTLSALTTPKRKIWAMRMRRNSQQDSLENLIGLRTPQKSKVP